MNLKDAFRYQNYLSDMLDKLSYNIAYMNPVKVTETHNRSKACPEAEDEVIDATEQRFVNASIDDILEFMEDVEYEKGELSREIAKAKAATEFCLDAEMANNRTARKSANILKGLIAKGGEKEEKKEGRSYRINVEGNQVPYSYEVVRHMEPDFDVDKVRERYKSKLSQADRTSSEIDRYLLDTNINFYPLFDINEHLEEAIVSFLKRKKK